MLEEIDDIIDGMEKQERAATKMARKQKGAKTILVKPRVWRTAGEAEKAEKDWGLREQAEVKEQLEIFEMPIFGE